MTRRMLNVLLAMIGLILAIPVIVVLLVAIRIDSKGNPILAQQRVGLRQQKFSCFKLRTMFIETSDAASHLTSPKAVTPIGRILRRWKLDEIPQLWNVIVGDMDLVGPRPCLPSQKELIEARDAFGVYGIRPGITGLAQVQGVDMSDADKLARLDREYMLKRNWLSDFSIIMQTMKGSGSGDKVGV
jgi:lipopolysaccharide/colanic/teichoic acid biosynthesis glycosyltransferase